MIDMTLHLSPARRLVIALWRGWLPQLLPWRVRMAVWNWMWNYAPDNCIDWRTHKRIGRA